MQAKTHIFLNDDLLYFLPITVSFLTYLVIFTPDKTLLIFQLSLTYLFHVSNKIPGSIPFQITAHLREISKHLTWHLPQVFACYLLLTAISLHLLQILHYDRIHLLH